MVGYIRAGRTISAHLAPAFAQRQSPLGVKGVPLPSFRAVQPITPKRSIGAYTSEALRGQEDGVVRAPFGSSILGTRALEIVIVRFDPEASIYVVQSAEDCARLKQAQIRAR